MDAAVTSAKKRLENDLTTVDPLLNEEDSDEDSDYIPDHEEGSVTSDDEDDTILHGSTKTPTEAPPVISKRKSDVLGDENPTPKKAKTEMETEAERRARVDAIWAEMNKKDNNEKKQSTLGAEKEKQPLDDISASLNQTNTPPPSSTMERPRHSPSTIVAPPRKKAGIVRPKSTLSALVSQYNIKVPKMNTLEKSRADWQGFVNREGIRDELKYQNKDGYMEKVAFLQRVDDRRLTHLKSGRKAPKR